ncbi:MAG TPA: hypothetical protein DDW65_02240 [Firmicutes bacterium]|jgi:YHS domain-containing protein|nr:hypothetical protein [Bacillota bacterium]
MNLGNTTAILVVAIIMFLVGRKIFRSGSCCCNHDSSTGNGKKRVHDSIVKSDGQKQASPTGEKARDAICGMDIVKDSAITITTEINGETYYFCCLSCARKFALKNRI